MIIGIGNVGSTSLKSKIIDINDRNEIKVIGEANLDKIKTDGESNFVHSIGDETSVKEVINIVGFGTLTPCAILSRQALDVESGTLLSKVSRNFF